MKPGVILAQRLKDLDNPRVTGRCGHGKRRRLGEANEIKRVFEAIDPKRLRRCCWNGSGMRARRWRSHPSMARVSEDRGGPVTAGGHCMRPAPTRASWNWVGSAARRSQEKSNEIAAIESSLPNLALNMFRLDTIIKLSLPRKRKLAAGKPDYRFDLLRIQPVAEF